MIDKSDYAAPAGIPSLAQTEAPIEIEIVDPEEVKIGIDGVEIDIEPGADSDEVEFDATRFLRQNPTEIGALITTLFDLVDETGRRVVTVAEARALLDLPARELGIL
jgi:hypothetical protein